MEGIEMKAKIGVVGAGTYGSVLINAYYCLLYTSDAADE